jgi:hypothetical protein
MPGLLKKTQNAMESDKRNHQTNEDLFDAKLTMHRKLVDRRAAARNHYPQYWSNCQNLQRRPRISGKKPENAPNLWLKGYACPDLQWSTGQLHRHQYLILRIGATVSWRVASSATAAQNRGKPGTPTDAGEPPASH